ncbi:glycoside hydrolase family 18 protein [Solitalea sp. MAHUQ-68]|uniref:chitinase n=1 Tax=Solitalea agri TaxID=2953739 RepID=A0A9X2F7L2_9SPHI|nr:glycoside hydrolase family 18 protein [Solitalea agri]MCO4293178.1 glycoside hydrolase family 18 protein [Solitalea agri]
MILSKAKFLVTCFALLSISLLGYSQAKKDFKVIAYFWGSADEAKQIQAEKITHVIFSFCHLKGNKLNVDREADTATIQELVALKQRNPKLRVLLSLGGWEGCPTCSDAFSTAAGRTEFAQSVKQLSDFFKTDGIDLDWEYPAIEGPPGHKFTPEDKPNFTALVTELRKVLGKKMSISFAAGGFQKAIEESIDWKSAMPQVDFVNLMSYDLVNGYSVKTGHHTALYSSPQQKESTDNAVTYLLNHGVPSKQIVIGAAFYGRMWENVPMTENGLYQSGKFKTGFSYEKIAGELLKDKDFTYYWDDTAKAPYLYNAKLMQYLTYDDKKSIELKTQYAIDKKLGGIMFWEIKEDAKQDGLLDVIDSVKKR